MERGISPPPSKRQKRELDAPTQHAPVSKASWPIVSFARGTIRIFSWNINGISPFLQTPITAFFSPGTLNQPKEAPASLRGFLHRHRWPAVLFLQEVKIASQDTKTQGAVRKALNEYLPHEISSSKGPTYRADFTLPTDQHNARGLRGSGKVYGVCSIVRSDLFSDFKATVRTVEWDQEGRVSVVEITSLLGKYALFNIYAVNGTENIYRDPMTGAVCGTRHDRKLAFHRLLAHECNGLVNKGWHVILAGDMNVAPSAIDGHPGLRTFPHQHVLNRADFNARFLTAEQQGIDENESIFKGVDVWRKLRGDARRYSYYPRNRPWGTSCDRVDYVIADWSTWNDALVTAAGILDSEFERGPSDHVPIWVDIKVEDEKDEGEVTC